jgi:deoxyribodipyrimidine photo-lyase
MTFSTDIASIWEKIDRIDPVAYGQTRNYVDGDVTYLSPYLSRGVISTRQVAAAVLAKGYKSEQVQRFLQELAWREYFQRVWQQLGDDMFEDIRVNRTSLQTAALPAAIAKACTGIEAIDLGIEKLYSTGYMHNHLRMYTASLVCNIGKSYWKMPSQWMYYHLLDGDLASNTCSWQWVAGSFSSKKYYCNQENINKYCHTQQKNTLLDHDYSLLPTLERPEALLAQERPELRTELPSTPLPSIDPLLPLHIYHNYHLDPSWRANEPANRVLLLEPSHFAQYPVSKKVIDFILALAKNIEGLQVYCGEFSDIPHAYQVPSIFTREHPAYQHIPGHKDARDWMFPQVSRYYPSFFGFWKKASPYVQKLSPAPLQTAAAY